VSLLAIGAAFAVLLTLLLELTVVRPVARLSAFVSSVGTKLSSRVPATGRDEIGNLGRSVNDMLDTIERHSMALAQANTQLDHERQIVELLNHSLEDKVADRTRDLETANDELRDRNRQLVTAMRQATTDGLTGLLNHRSFQEFIRTADEQKADAELVVFMADIDHFKSVNDLHGHQRGDEILTAVGDVFRKVLGEECVFRYGGDEFAMVTWLPSAARAEEVAEEMRRRVETGLTSPAVTVSIGVALYSDAASPEKLVYHADAAMYAAKAAGKNQVKLWAPGAVLLTVDTKGSPASEEASATADS
jgi:diguanylate cyclase (GGDEF)-like protein